MKATRGTKWSWNLALATLIFCMVPAPGDGNEVSTSPLVLAAKVGTDASFSCTSSLNNNSVVLQWRYANGTEVSSNESKRVHTVNSSLNLAEVQHQDHGVYICADNVGHEANVTLKVYEPYSYFMEGMVVVGINCGLILIFIICLIYTCYKEKGLTNKKNRRFT